MRTNVDSRGGQASGGFGQTVRGMLAYLVLGLGVAGTMAILPLAIVGLAARGFH